MSTEKLVSKLTSKSQVVIPQAVRRQLSLMPGDRIRYRMRGQQVTIEKVIEKTGDDPFIAFDEWASAGDDAAFADL